MAERSETSTAQLISALATLDPACETLARVTQGRRINPPALVLKGGWGESLLPHASEQASNSGEGGAIANLNKCSLPFIPSQSIDKLENLTSTC